MRNLGQKKSSCALNADEGGLVIEVAKHIGRLHSAGSEMTYIFMALHAQAFDLGGTRAVANVDKDRFRSSCIVC
jgi:hypothetical protein